MKNKIIAFIASVLIVSLLILVIACICYFLENNPVLIKKNIMISTLAFSVYAVYGIVKKMLDKIERK